MKATLKSSRLTSSTPYAVNRYQPGTVNDCRGAVVCICLDSGVASKSKRAAFIVEACNASGPLFDALRIAVSVIEDFGLQVPTYCREILNSTKE